MKIVGMLRVRNEGRWIHRVVESILPICDNVIVFDDHSDDGLTQMNLIPYMPRVRIFDSPFTGLDEVRDKNYLLDTLTHLFEADWIVSIDGDEVLAPSGIEPLRAAMNTGASCLSLKILYLWDREDQVRTDGVYGDFHRESIFRPNGARFVGDGNGPNFHCGNVPAQIRQKRTVLQIPLLHLGYMHREDRVRKYHFYTATDPKNFREDQYRHMVVGDLFPAESKFQHGGPLKLSPLVQ